MTDLRFMHKLGIGAAFAAALAGLVFAASVSARTTRTTSSPPEFVFPADVGSPGQSLPEHACKDPSPSANCSVEGGFNRSDYNGWKTLNGVNERMTWASDPAGSSHTVARFDVYGNDNADQYGGTRTSLWRNPDNCSGCTAWQTFGVLIPSGFQYPDGWFLLYQDFSSGGNPAQSLELMGAGCVSAAPRNHLCWKDQTATTSGIHRFDLGAVRQGHWFYITENIEFLNTSSGFDNVWDSWDTKPNVSLAPAVHWSGITAYTTGANRSNILLYRATSTASQHQTVYYCGFHRAASAATSQELPNC
jgi:hypothetical protein